MHLQDNRLGRLGNNIYEWTTATTTTTFQTPTQQIQLNTTSITTLQSSNTNIAVIVDNNLVVGINSGSTSISTTTTATTSDVVEIVNEDVNATIISSVVTGVEVTSQLSQTLTSSSSTTTLSLQARAFQDLSFEGHIGEILTFALLNSSSKPIQIPSLHTLTHHVFVPSSLDLTSNNILTVLPDAPNQCGDLVGTTWSSLGLSTNASIFLNMPIVTSASNTLPQGSTLCASSSTAALVGKRTALTYTMTIHYENSNFKDVTTDARVSISQTVVIGNAVRDI
ncbi:hypothetical protein OAV88_02995 [bacterium]|nr:hypothetical protein [bacterium]